MPLLTCFGQVASLRICFVSLAGSAILVEVWTGVGAVVVRVVFRSLAV